MRPWRPGGSVSSEKWNGRRRLAERTPAENSAPWQEDTNVDNNNSLRTSAQGLIVLGIDIGSTGAIAALTGAGDLIAVHDMPTLRDGPAGRPAVNGPLLAEIVAKSHATIAFVEFVAARPTDGPTGAFAFGRSRGLDRRRLRRPWANCELPDASGVEAQRRHCAWQGRRKRRRT